MKRTGIFFTYFEGERLKDFPGSLVGLLEKDNIAYYDAVYARRDGLFYLEPATEELLLKVHSPRMIEEVKRTGDYEAALYSAGGTVDAAREIRKGNIDNAFVFTSFGDHHAGKDFYGGMCYFNGAAIAISDLKEHGFRSFCIVDTDAHHGDGTRDIFKHDADVLHVCFCHYDYSDQYNKVDIHIPHRTTDAEYREKMRNEFVPRALEFRPEYIFWEYGYDATRGDYGDKGISLDAHIRFAEIIKGVAEKVSKGRLVTILCGGSRRDIARYTIPKIIAILAELRLTNSS